MLTPLLKNLSKVPDVRAVLGHTHENHKLDLEKAEKMAISIIREQQSLSDSHGAKSGTAGLNNRPLSLNTDDYDLNDRASEMDILRGSEHPFGPKRHTRQTTPSS